MIKYKIEPGYAIFNNTKAEDDGCIVFFNMKTGNLDIIEYDLPFINVEIDFVYNEIYDIKIGI